MLDRHQLRQDPDSFIKAIGRKGLTAPINELVDVLSQRSSLLQELEKQQAELNALSKSIGQLMAQGKRDEAEEAKQKTGALKSSIHDGETKQRDIDARLRDLELSIPNPPHDSVPGGLTEEDNVVARIWGEPSKHDKQPLPHWEIAEKLGLVDFERGAKISGSGFMVYTGWGARLQRALFSFMVDRQTLKNGYREIYPPYMVNEASLVGTGQLPKFADELYKASEDDLYLIPTAEVPVTNLYRDEILNSDQLTMKMAAFSSCFRREAGAAGKDTRGVQRVHQFDKVELVKLTRPEESYDELEALVKDAEDILQVLGIHYRVTLLCAGEMSFGNAKCYDLEIWAPGVAKFLEVSSCSNFEAFQARRANIRFRRSQGDKPEFVHTLNGSGVATPRLFAAILETFQQPDGSVVIPEPLRPYVGTDVLRNE